MTGLAHEPRPRVFRVATSKTASTILKTQLSLVERAGFDVTCVCDDDEWTPGIRELGVDVVPLGMGRRPGPLRALLWGYRFYRVLKQQRPDVVHTHNAFHGLVGRPAARLARVPVVVQTVHNWWYLEPPRSPTATAYRLLERLGARLTDAMLFINHDDVRRAEVQHIAPAARTYFVGNGIDTGALDRRLSARSREQERAALGLAAGEIAVTMIARLERPKDHRTLLKAFALLDRPGVRLFLAGQGLEEQSVRALVSTLGIADRVRLLGHLDDVSGLLSASDVVVLASECEGFGRCLVEGMVAGLPVVGSDVAGIRDVIEPERTGLLCAPGDPVALCDALARLADDPELRSRLGRAGRETALATFDEGKLAERTVEIYRSLLEPRQA